MKPIPKRKRLLLQKKSMKEQIKKLREMVYGSTWMGKGVSGSSYPGPEPGKLHSLGTTFRKQDGNPSDTRSSKSSPKTTGREKERKWRRKL